MAGVATRRLVNAAKFLIVLKDGPRDDYYRDNKDHAWQMLRDAIEACKAEQEERTVSTLDSKEGQSLLICFTDNGGEVYMNTGPRPYLWIGDRSGRCVATIEADLIEVRDAITRALREARKY